MKLTLLLAILSLDLTATAFRTAPEEEKPSKVPTILEDPLLHLGFAWKDVSSWTSQAAKDAKAGLDKVDLHGAVKWAQQAGRDIKAETDKIKLTGANAWIHRTAADTQHALNRMNNTDFQRWLKQASKDVGLEATLDDLQAVKLEELPEETLRYIRENPEQTLFYVVEGVAFFTPGLIYGPLLKVLGFSARGVKAGTLAAHLQKAFCGAVPAGSWFAHLTSAGAGGYGAATLNGLMRLGSLVARVVKGVVDHTNSTKAGHQEL